MQTRRKGFTLVELAIVIAILGILALVAIPKYTDMVKQARSAEARAQLGSVRSAISIYYASNKGTFPTSLSGTLFADGTVPFVEITTDSDGAVVVSSNVVAPTATYVGGWFYTAATGVVRINSNGLDVSAAVSWNTY